MALPYYERHANAFWKVQFTCSILGVSLWLILWLSLRQPIPVNKIGLNRTFFIKQGSLLSANLPTSPN